MSLANLWQCDTGRQVVVAENRYQGDMLGAFCKKLRICDHLARISNQPKSCLTQVMICRYFLPVRADPLGIPAAFCYRLVRQGSRINPPTGPKDDQQAVVSATFVA